MTKSHTLFKTPYVYAPLRAFSDISRMQCLPAFLNPSGAYSLYPQLYSKLHTFLCGFHSLLPPVFIGLILLMSLEAPWGQAQLPSTILGHRRI